MKLKDLLPLVWEYVFFGVGYRRAGEGDSLGRSVLGVTSIHTRLRSLHLLLILNKNIILNPILEIGFGDGYLILALARRYPHLEFEGWEVDLGRVEKARARAKTANLQNVIFKQTDLTATRTMEGHYGLIYSVDVLEHIPDDYYAVRQMAALLRSDGLLLIHVPLRRSLQRRFLPGFKGHSDPGHVREEYTSSELLALAEQAGIKSAKLARTFGFWGELAFEINSLMWRWTSLDSVWRALTMPLLLPLGLLDVALPLRKGNSLVLTAGKEADAPSQGQQTKTMNQA